MKLALASILAGSAAAFAPALNSNNVVSSSSQLYARKPLISGNWKLNPQTKDEAISLAKGIAASITEDSPDADVALFVPYVFIESAMSTVGDKLSVGAEVSDIIALDVVEMTHSPMYHFLDPSPQFPLTKTTSYSPSFFISCIIIYYRESAPK